MLGVASFLIFAVLSLLSTTHAAIGPIAELDIVNKVIAPDGFSRSCVVHCFFVTDKHPFISSSGPLWRGVPFLGLLLGVSKYNVPPLQDLRILMIA